MFHTILLVEVHIYTKNSYALKMYSALYDFLAPFKHKDKKLVDALACQFELRPISTNEISERVSLYRHNFV